MKINHYGWWIFLRGLCAFVFGLIALFWPGITLEILVLWFGAYVLIDGVVGIIASYQAAKHHEKWWLLLLDGFAGLALGIMTFVWPVSTAWVLVTFIAAWALVTGVLELAAAFSSSWPSSGKWLLALGGLASILLGGMMLANPVGGALAIVFLIGIYASVFGILIMAMGWSLRKTQVELKVL